MTFRTNLIVATLLATGTLTLSSPPAAAQIICNEWGRCWHPHMYHGYGSEWGHPRRWGEERHHGWREHQGYDWRGGHGNGRHGDDERQGYGYWRGGHGDDERD